MKLYPYSKLQTTNLKLLLFAARCLGFLGLVLIIFSIVVGAFGVILDQPRTMNFGGINGTMSAPGTTLPSLLFALWGIFTSIFVLAFSGLCAAVVSCEHKYTSTPE